MSNVLKHNNMRRHDPQLPKLRVAGSNPVFRSMDSHCSPIGYESIYAA